MPLRDHFHPPLSDFRSWDGLHGAWPTLIVMDLNKRLSRRFVAAPRIHLEGGFEIDVAATREEEPSPFTSGTGGSDGGTATAVWAPPEPTLSVVTDLPQQDEYEVQVFEVEGRRLVAAVEIVSPANKDRPETRRAFVAKCAALLHQGVSVSIVDLVTSRGGNLYSDLLDLIGESDPSFSTDASLLYASACRWRRDGDAGKFETWTHALAVNRPLPVLPLWLSADLAVPLDLESTYEESCRVLRIP
jgi:Protein of unknown function (DUF4058)